MKRIRQFAGLLNPLGIVRHQRKKHHLGFSSNSISSLLPSDPAAPSGSSSYSSLAAASAPSSVSSSPRSGRLRSDCCIGGSPQPRYPERQLSPGPDQDAQAFSGDLGRDQALRDSLDACISCRSSRRAALALTPGVNLLGDWLRDTLDRRCGCRPAGSLVLHGTLVPEPDQAAVGIPQLSAVAPSTSSAARERTRRLAALTRLSGEGAGGAIRRRVPVRPGGGGKLPRRAV